MYITSFRVYYIKISRFFHLKKFAMQMQMAICPPVG